MKRVGIRSLVGELRSHMLNSMPPPAKKKKPKPHFTNMIKITELFTNGIFCRTRTKNLKICMEIQKTLNSQSHFEKEKLEESGSLTSDYAIKLQSSRHYGTGTETEI